MKDSKKRSRSLGHRGLTPQCSSACKRRKLRVVSASEKLSQGVRRARLFELDLPNAIKKNKQTKTLVESATTSIDLDATAAGTTITNSKLAKIRAWDLPPEIWAIVAAHLESRSDLLNLSLTCWSGYIGVLPHLYARPLIATPEYSPLFLATFCDIQNLGLKYIKHLTITPVCSSARYSCRPFAQSTTQITVHQLISALPHMPNLVSLAMSCCTRLDREFLLSHGLRSLRKDYTRAVVPDRFFAHAICFRRNGRVWVPKYTMWASDPRAVLNEEEQRALLTAQLKMCHAEGVWDAHTLAWRICG